MKISKIDDAEKFLAESPEIKRNLRGLIGKSIADKKALFKTEDIVGVDALVEFGLLNESSTGRFEFDFSSLIVCRAYHTVAEEIMQSELPKDIISALEFADQFYLKLREPKPNHQWYFHLNMEFDRYVLIYLNEFYNVDVTAFYPTITHQMLDDVKPLRHFDMAYYQAFPYLNDEIPKCFEILSWIFFKSGKEYNASSALSEIGKHNPEKAILLYSYGQMNNATELVPFLPILQHELYNCNPEKYFSEACETLKKNTEIGIYSLTYLPFSDKKQIDKALSMFDQIDINDESLSKHLPNFYARLIENSYSSEEAIKKSFLKINALLECEIDGVRFNMLNRLSMIENFEAEKFKLLPKILVNYPFYIREFFRRFKKPEYLFQLIRQAYTIEGANVNFTAYAEACSQLQHNNPTGFEVELIKLLTDDLGINRLAGMMVLESKYGGMYDVDFLKTDKIGQFRIIKSFLAHPRRIEDLLPLIIQLRKSNYPEIRGRLLSEMVELIVAYDQHLLELLLPLLDLEDEVDINFYQQIKDAHDEYQVIRVQKASIKEFDPTINELEFMDDYFQIEHEARAERMANANVQSWTQMMAQEIIVIRGSAFKSENSDQITAMSAVSTSMLMDMRYFIDPDKYQSEYSNTLIGIDYTNWEEKS